MATLRHFSQSGTAAIPLGARPVLVGSSLDNDIVVGDPRSPAIAARIVMRDGSPVVDVIRQGSVKVNGRKVRSQALGRGDRLEIGTSVLVVDDDEKRDQRPAAADDAGPVLDTFARFADAVGRERDLKQLLRRIIDSLFAIVGGEEAFIFHLDEEGKPRVFVSSSGDSAEERFSDTVVQDVLRSGVPVCIPNALADPRFSAAKSIADLKLTTVLCCPIAVAGSVMGVIYLGSKNPAVSFTERNLNALRLYALMAGMLINHVAFITQQHTTIRRLAELKGDDDIVADAPVMKSVLDQIASVAASDITVLLEGDTGTGKDLMAQVIHRQSLRREGKFVPVNCSSLRGELLESELFGHRKGSFTGAIRDHDGLFVAANDGTLFLDEIGEMDVSLQAKLLRTLESNMVRPVGASGEVPVNVRIICATNKDLKRMVEEGRFRQDLYFRLNQFSICLPPLRDRGHDIVVLAYFFLERYKAQYPAKKIVDFHPDSIKAISFYDWPGNVRELSSMVHKAVLTAAEPLVRLEIEGSGTQFLTFDDATKEFQKKLVQRALNACNGNREAAARLLGMSRSSFFRYLSGGTEQS